MATLACGDGDNDWDFRQRPAMMQRAASDCLEHVQPRGEESNFCRRDELVLSRAAETS